MTIKLINIIVNLYNILDKKYDYTNFEEWWNTIYSPS